MEYYFKENLHLFYASGQLYDSNDREVYRYENETWLLPETVLYRNGRRVGHVKKNFTFFMNNYDIYVGDRLEDTLQQHFRFFSSELELEKRGWVIKGDFFNLDYEIRDRNDKIICRVTQEVFRMTRRYFIDIRRLEDEEFIILLVLAINQFDKDAAAASSSAANAHHH